MIGVLVSEVQISGVPLYLKIFAYEFGANQNAHLPQLGLAIVSNMAQPSPHVPLYNYYCKLSIIIY